MAARTLTTAQRVIRCGGWRSSASCPATSSPRNRRHCACWATGTRKTRSPSCGDWALASSSPRPTSMPGRSGGRSSAWTWHRPGTRAARDRRGRTASATCANCDTTPTNRNALAAARPVRASHCRPTSLRASWPYRTSHRSSTRRNAMPSGTWCGRIRSGAATWWGGGRSATVGRCDSAATKRSAG